MSNSNSDAVGQVISNFSSEKAGGDFTAAASGVLGLQVSDSLHFQNDLDAINKQVDFKKLGFSEDFTIVGAAGGQLITVGAAIARFSFTGLPSQKACLDIMGRHGEGKARALAEVATALVLGGELSINGAMSCGEFTRAHQRLVAVASNRAKRAYDEPFKGIKGQKQLKNG